LKVFIAIRVPRGDKECEQTAAVVAQAAQQAEHEVFVAYQEIARLGLSPAQFMPFVRQHIRTSDLAIIVYHPDLRGGLIEEGIAYADHVPIWLLHKTSELHSDMRPISSSALACADLVIEYATLEELKQKLEQAFEAM
jgi:hypothetical protein